MGDKPTGPVEPVGFVSLPCAYSAALRARLGQTHAASVGIRRSDRKDPRDGLGRSLTADGDGAPTIIYDQSTVQRA